MPDSTLKLTPLRLIEGIWEGELTGLSDPDAPPVIEVQHGGEAFADAELERLDDHRWLVRAELPAERISDGAQAFVLALGGTDERLASFAVIAGDALRDDLRAEVALMREELTMLKRALRRHARES